MASVLIEKVRHMNRREKTPNGLVNAIATKAVESFRWIGDGQLAKVRK
jgi:hypothetical protein